MRSAVMGVGVLAMIVGVTYANYQTHKANVRTEEAMRASHELAVTCYQSGYQHGRIAMMQEVIHRTINADNTVPEICK